MTIRERARVMAEELWSCCQPWSMYEIIERHLQATDQEAREQVAAEVIGLAEDEPRRKELSEALL
jgi:hypothetical protein